MFFLCSLFIVLQNAQREYSSNAHSYETGMESVNQSKPGTFVQSSPNRNVPIHPGADRDTDSEDEVENVTNNYEMYEESSMEQMRSKVDQEDESDSDESSEDEKEKNGDVVMEEKKQSEQEEENDTEEEMEAADEEGK